LICAWLAVCTFAQDNQPGSDAKNDIPPQAGDESGAYRNDPFSVPRNESAYQYLQDENRYQLRFLFKSGIGLVPSSKPLAVGIEAGVNINSRGRLALALEGYNKRLKYTKEAWNGNTYSWEDVEVEKMTNFVPLLLSYDHLLSPPQEAIPQPFKLYANLGIGTTFANRAGNAFCVKTGCSMFYPIKGSLGFEASLKIYLNIADRYSFLLPVTMVGLTIQ
jgi:hypothetical protein